MTGSPTGSPTEPGSPGLDRSRGAMLIGVTLAVFTLALIISACLALYADGWQKVSAHTRDEATALERARAGMDATIAKVRTGQIDLPDRLDPEDGAGGSAGAVVWPASDEAGLCADFRATVVIRRLATVSADGGSAWPWARIESTGADGEADRTVALVLKPEFEDSSPGLFGEYGFVTRGRLILDKTTDDAVDTRDGSADSQAVGGQSTKVLSFGQIIVRHGAHVDGDVLTSYEQKTDGSDLPLDADGWLMSPRRKDAAIVLRGSDDWPVVVEGDVRATRGTIFVNDYATVEGEASTNGIDESGLIDGWGFRPNEKIGDERFFTGGTIEGGWTEDGPEVLGDAIVHDDFMGDLIADAQAIAIESGAGVAEAGADGVLGTSDDTFRMGDFEPDMTNDPASTFWDGISTGNNSAVTKNATISHSGLAFEDGSAIKAGSVAVVNGNETSISLQDITMGAGEVLTIDTGTDPAKTLTIYVKSAIGLNSTGQFQSTGSGKLNIITNGMFTQDRYTVVDFQHSGTTGFISNAFSPATFSTEGDLNVHARSGSINIDGVALNASHVTVGGDASFSTNGGEVRVTGESILTVEGAMNVDCPNASTPGSGLGDGSFRVEGTLDVHGNFTADVDNIWFKAGSIVTFRGDENKLFAIRDVTFGKDSDVSEGSAAGESTSEAPETSDPDDGTELDDDATDDDPVGTDPDDDANVTFTGGAIQIYVNLGGEDRVDPVRIRNGATFHGAIFAPYSRVSMGGSAASFVGAAIGEKLVVTRGADLRHDIGLGTIKPGSSGSEGAPGTYEYVGGVYEPTVVDPAVGSD